MARFGLLLHARVWDRELPEAGIMSNTYPDLRDADLAQFFDHCLPVSFFENLLTLPRLAPFTPYVIEVASLCRKAIPMHGDLPIDWLRRSHLPVDLLRIILRHAPALSGWSTIAKHTFATQRYRYPKVNPLVDELTHNPRLSQRRVVFFLAALHGIAQKLVARLNEDVLRRATGVIREFTGTCDPDIVAASKICYHAGVAQEWTRLTPHPFETRGRLAVHHRVGRVSREDASDALAYLAQTAMTLAPLLRPGAAKGIIDFLLRSDLSDTAIEHAVRQHASANSTLVDCDPDALRVTAQAFGNHPHSPTSRSNTVLPWSKILKR